MEAKIHELAGAVLEESEPSAAVVSLCCRILGSNIGRRRNESHSGTQVLELYGESIAVRFEELELEIRSHRTIRDVGALMKVLFALGAGAQKRGYTKYGAEGGEHRQRWDVALRSVSRPTTITADPALIEAARRFRKDEDEAKKKEKKEHAAALRKERFSPEEEIQIEAQEEGEARLVRDVLWCVQGIDGSSVYRSLSAGEGYIVSRELAPKISIVDRTRELCELGWLYRRIIRLCGDGRDIQQLGSSSKTLTALCSALREELAEYYRLIAILESQAALAKSSIQDDAEIEEQRLSLRRLAIWTMEPKERLKCMAAISDAVRPNHVRGGALLSVLHSRTKHGDPATHKLLVSLTTRASQPMFIALRNWILAGELAKRDDDFFVFSTTDEKKIIDSSYTFWRHKYKLRRSNVPSFLADPQSILDLGKTINFMRHCCGAKNTTNGNTLNFFVLHDDDDKTPSKEEDDIEHTAFRYGGSSTLRNLVRDRSDKANRRLVAALMGPEFQLMDHLRALKACLLLAQGDFAVLLVRKLADSLKPKTVKAFSVSGRHDVWTAVYAAVRGSNAVKLPTLEACLRVVIASNESTDTAPNNITLPRSSGLDYAPPQPIDAVVHPEALALYRRIHDTMLARAFVEAHLNDTWRQHRLASRALNRLPAHIRLVLHRCALARGRMARLVQALGQRYNTAVDANWACLVDQLRAGGSLDQLILAHDTYLKNVAVHVLLEPKPIGALPHADDFGLAASLESTADRDDCLALAELLATALQHASTFCALLTNYINDALTADHRSDQNTYRADLLSRLVGRLDEAIGHFDDANQRIVTLLTASNSLILADFAVHLNASLLP